VLTYAARTDRSVLAIRFRFYDTNADMNHRKPFLCVSRSRSLSRVRSATPKSRSRSREPPPLTCPLRCPSWEPNVSFLRSSAGMAVPAERFI